MFYIGLRLGQNGEGDGRGIVFSVVESRPKNIFGEFNRETIVGTSRYRLRVVSSVLLGKLYIQHIRVRRQILRGYRRINKGK